MNPFRAALLAAACLLLVAPASADEQPGLLDKLERAIQLAADRGARAVVSIDVSRVEDAKSPQRRTARRTNPLQQMMQQFFRGMRRTHGAYYKRPVGPVTGFVVRQDGVILTSWYNVAGKLDGIRVTLADGRRLPAELLGTDRTNDLALLKVAAEGLPALDVSAGSAPAIGSFAVVASRGTAGAGAVWGIISATTRDGGRALQIDARTNYGNAGAPVVDLRGRVLGVVTKVAHWNRFGVNSGVSYAAKASYIAKVMPRLLAGETIEPARRPLLGLRGEDADGGLQLTQVTPNGPAGKAGLQPGDLLTHFDGKPVTGIIQLIQLLGKYKPEQKVPVTVRRGDETLKLAVVLGVRPEGQ